MSDEKMRAEFEAWIVNFLDDAELDDIVAARSTEGENTIYKFEGDVDSTMTITAMWLAWQASRASLCVELPESEKDERPYKCYASGWNDMRMECAAALDKAGVKYR